MSMIEGVLMGMAARTRQRTEAEDREALKKRREQEDEDRAFTMSERQRAIQLRTDMGRAAATVEPVEVKQDRPDTMDNRDVGQAGEAPLPTAGYDVAGKRFSDKAAATKAAAEANTPQAVTTRMSDVLMRSGDPVQAQKLRTGAMEEQTAQFKLNDAMRADIDARFNADLQANVKDWGSLEKFVSESASDGSGGKVKYRLSVSPDGKNRIVNIVDEDGSLHPTEKVIPNTSDGLATAIAELARMPADKKLAHLHQKAMLEQQAERDAATAKYHAGMLKVAQQNANTQEQYRKDQVAALQAKAAGGTPVLEPFDAKLARDTAHDAVRAENKRRADAGQPPMTGEQAAAMVESHVSAQRNQHNNGLIISAAVNDLNGLAPDSPEYAQVYSRALGFGNPEQIAAQLKARGIQPPVAQATKSQAIGNDMAKTGVKDAISFINGRPATFGKATMSDFSQSAIAGKPGVPAARAEAAAAPAVSMSSVVASKANMSADPPEGKALDAARTERAAAELQLRRWGQAQRAKDPQGFANAVAQRDAAVQREAEAQRAWQALIGQEAPAFARPQSATARR